MYKKKYSHPIVATLNLTDACNLCCKYCFVQQQPHIMELHTAYQAVNYLYNNFLWHQKYNKEMIKNYHQVYLNFFGGEPTLCYDNLILPIVEYAKSIDKKLFQFNITTNGTLLNKEKIDYFKANNFSMLLSMDGDKITQDINRPCHDKNISSFDLIYPNLPYLLSQYPNITFRSTIEYDTVQYFYENFLFVKKNNFKSFFALPNHRKLDWSQEQIAQLKYQLKLLYIDLINSFINYDVDNIISCTFVNNALNTILTHDIGIYLNKANKKIQKKIERCGFGTVSCSIGYDGTLYGCQEQATRDSNIFVIGDIYNGIDKTAQKTLIDSYLSEPNLSSGDLEQCNSCLVKHYCTNVHECFSTSYDLYGKLNKINPVRCIWIEENLKNAIVMMKILTEQKNKLFEQYLYKNVIQYRQVFLSKKGIC